MEDEVIRFIDLGKQIALDENDPDWPRQFAFYDTIFDQFVKINSYVVFDSMAELMANIQEDGSLTPSFVNRIIGLMPEWAKRIEVESPRMSQVVGNFDGGKEMQAAVAYGEVEHVKSPADINQTFPVERKQIHVSEVADYSGPSEDDFPF